jgi:hypothetical protein
MVTRHPNLPGYSGPGGYKVLRSGRARYVLGKKDTSRRGMEVVSLTQPIIHKSEDKDKFGIY